jgi:hypothetical protein
VKVPLRPQIFLKKTVSLERSLVLPPVFDRDKYEALSVQLETVRLDGVCTIDLIKSLMYTVRELSEDVALLKSDNASLKSQINKLHRKVYLPQGPLSSRVGLQADMEFADATSGPSPASCQELCCGCNYWVYIEVASYVH